MLINVKAVHRGPPVVNAKPMDGLKAPVALAAKQDAIRTQSSQKVIIKVFLSV